jgi:glycosyltransferase involved in cell wall biosynthesis
MVKKLVIIPAFNEAESILDVVREIPESFDFLVVNDGSTDETEKILKENEINFVSLPHNLGIGAAVQTGYKYALYNNYDIAIQLDGDGQHDPKFLQKLIEPILKEEADFAIGTRFLEKNGFQSTFFRRMGIKVFQVVNSMLIGQKITDNTSGFRAINKPLISLFSKNYPQDYPEPESIIFAGQNEFKIKEVPVIMRERMGGKSSISGFSSINYMIKVLLAIFATFVRGKA